ncbi:MAG: hypothetical protein PHQ60_01955 [Sideroxydans sp.]|nr:hypothetical protein [Sideroxydans sp.]MDD5056606.1 hypothetical protein [Sideroxydans sp.]
MHWKQSANYLTQQLFLLQRKTINKIPASVFDGQGFFHARVQSRRPTPPIAVPLRPIPSPLHRTIPLDLMRASLARRESLPPHPSFSNAQPSFRLTFTSSCL